MPTMTKKRARLTVVDPATEAKIEAYHRGQESYTPDAAARQPILDADSPVIGRELQTDLLNGLMQGAF